MSLINEALKKAQRQRAEAPPAVVNPATPADAAAQPNARIAKRRPPMPARTQVILIGGAVALLVMGGIFSFVFFFEETPPPRPAKPAAVANAKPLPKGPAPVIQDLPQQPAIQVALPPVAPPAVDPVVATPADTAPAQIQKPALADTTPPPPADLTPKANPKVYEFLEALKVSGIRTSDTDPKVIMNDRVYRLNDLVDRATGLRLLRVDSSVLTFVDPSGFEYRKTF